jgi:AAA domain-containing protein
VGVDGMSNGSGRPAAVPPPAEIHVENWYEFERQTDRHVRCLVNGLWPEAALGFIAAPPKKGKTWLGIGLSLSVVSGQPFIGFEVPKPRSVLYVALEGQRPALRARIGCLARGLGLDPAEGGDDLWRLSLAYKPRGINLADPEWGASLVRAAEEINAGLVVVDVLRRAARFKENDAGDFAALALNLQPTLDRGTSIAMLHHFGKLSDLNRDRDPGERMSGSGAMFGALDVGIYITGSERGARSLRLEFDGRDLAMPETIGVELVGQGSGENGGYTFDDTCQLIRAAEIPREAQLKAPAADIAAYIIERGGRIGPAEIKDHFDIEDGTLRSRRDDLVKLGIAYVKQGRESVYVSLHPATRNPAALRDSATAGSKPHEHEESTPQPANPANQALRDSKSADLQGFPLPRNPALPTGVPEPLRGATPETQQEVGA